MPGHGVQPSRAVRYRLLLDLCFCEREMASRKKFPRANRKPVASRKAPQPAAPASNAPGAWFEKLVALQARLRAADGCPWDRQQTHTTLRTYLIEEAYEVLDALESGDDKKFAEEMGDLLLQVVFHSQIASEQGRFTVADVIREVHEKMVRRHPHVFGEQRAKDAEEVLKNWHEIKAQERRQSLADNGKGCAQSQAQESALDGVPRTLPATLEGLQLTKKASRIGFDWESVSGIFDKLREECTELLSALEGKNIAKVEEEVGDLLFAVVNLARFLGVDPEIALKQANGKFVRRFHSMERVAAARGHKIRDLPRAEMESLWNSAKQAESVPGRRKAGRSQ
jgi:tetrapyrrole methylase family protein/MazG family protein